MKKVQEPFCPYCTKVEQTVNHLFVSCPIAISFCSDFILWYQSLSKETITLCKNQLMYGILNNLSSCSALNHLILIGKFLLNCKSLNGVKLQFANFIALLQEKIEIGKYIAIMSNKCSTFSKKWSKFIN